MRAFKDLVGRPTVPLLAVLAVLVAGCAQVGTQSLTFWDIVWSMVVLFFWFMAIWIFIAIFGDMAPKVGKVMEPVGFKVVQVDVETGVISDFAVNRDKRHGPASLLRSGGLERPVSARFDPSGASLYVVDFGVLTVSEQGIAGREQTGALWRVRRTGGG